MNKLDSVLNQVEDLRANLRDMLDANMYQDASVVEAGELLEAELSHFHELAAEKLNQKPGLRSL